MHNPSASPSSSAAATAAAAMAGHNGGMTNGGGMMVGGANGYNLNSIMQSVGKKGSGTHSVTISPNALKMYQAKQKVRAPHFLTHAHTHTRTHTRHRTRT
jgi:hypothetical protein